MKNLPSLQAESANIEWPTIGIAAVCGLMIAITVIDSESITLWAAIPVLTVALTLYSSLQHEVLHGHPFNHRWLNEALVCIPAGLFVPYRRFRDTHIQHHVDSLLTDPQADPESNYIDPAIWQRMDMPLRILLRINNTLAGRMSLGPIIGLYVFYKGDIKAIAKGNFNIALAYMQHVFCMVPFVWWYTHYATMPVWAYVMAAYGAMSLLKVRTFLEHRAHENIQARTVIIESRGFFALLFLNNSFHLIHHNHPDMAWYRLPALYANQRDY